MKILVDEIGYDAWQIVYHKNLMVDLLKYLNEEDVRIINKLGYEVENKVYTEYEYDSLKGDIAKYYIDDEMEEREVAETMPLPEEITRDTYNNLLKKFDEIDRRYKKIM